MPPGNLASWLADQRWTDGEADQLSPEIDKAPPDDPNRQKIYNLLGADDYWAWIESAGVRDSEIIFQKDFQRDHVKTHFGYSLSKIGFNVTDGLDVLQFLERRSGAEEKK